MWVDYKGELINLDKVSTIRKAIGENTFNIILSESGKETKRMHFESLDELQEYFGFIKDELITTQNIKQKVVFPRL